jgi:hypothetical protein
MTPIDNQLVRGGLFLSSLKGNRERSELRFLLSAIWAGSPFRIVVNTNRLIRTANNTNCLGFESRV